MPQIDTATRWPNYREDDFFIKDYRFASGEVLPELRLHYRTMGMPRHDAAGQIVNGVLLLQGNTGTGANWLRPSLADELYGPGQPLDSKSRRRPALAERSDWWLPCLRGRQIGCSFGECRISWG